MEGQAKPSTLLPASSLFIAFLALGAVLVSETPFRGARPDMAASSPGVPEGVRARLWEDPFAAVERYRGMPDNDDADSVETRRQLCRHSSGLVSTPHSLTDLHCQMANITRPKTGFGLSTAPQTPRITLLAAMVFGGPYEGAVERRMRNRYAILSGLAASGYVPKDPEHIGYLDFAQPCKARLDAGQNGLSCEVPPIVPYEWLEPSNDAVQTAADTARARQSDADAILLLWLDDDELARVGHPLTTLAKLYSNLEKMNWDGKVELTFKVLGPAGSTNLRNIYEEERKLALGDVSRQDGSPPDYMQQEQQIRIYSSSATVDDEDIVDYRPGDFGGKRAQAPPYKNVLRTTSTDRDMAQTLICELERRGVDPVCRPSDVTCRKHVDQTCCQKDLKDVTTCSGRVAAPQFPANGDNTSPQEHPHVGYSGHLAHVVLVSEWDTFYGRSLPRVFEDVIKDDFGGSSTTETSGDVADGRLGWLHHFTYLRGLDGKVPGAKNERKGEREGEGKASERPTPGSDSSDIQRPVGQQQFDYLRRLATKLVALNKQLQSRNQGSIRAVGVLGSDDYDKLLILQALRTRLPGVLFFTTDLDTRLLHPAEKEWARNLLIASGFGLELSPRLQSDIPPFRDSYQTSLFLATMLATGKVSLPGQEKNPRTLNDCLRPRLFEVGLRGAVDLTVESTRRSGCSLQLSDGKILDALYPERQATQFMGYPILPVVLIVSIAILFTVWFIPTARDGMLAVVVALCLALPAYYLYLEEYLASDATAGEPFTFTDGVSVWPTEIIRLGSALLALFFIVVIISRLWRNALRISGQLGLSKPVFRVIATGKNSESEPRIHTFFHHLFLLGWGMSEKIEFRDFRKLWAEYINLGYSGSCFARVLVLVLVFELFGRWVMTELGRPDTPFRGPVSSTMNYWVLQIAVAAYLVLVFQVFDATRLAKRFVHILTKMPIGWPRETLEVAGQRFGLPATVAAERLRLQVIQRHMEALDPLIFYPFAVMFVMILSRSTFFDNWSVTPSLIIVIGASALFALGSAFLLRRAAREAKQATLVRLRDLMMMAKACEAGACDGATRQCMQIAGLPSKRRANVDISLEAAHITGIGADGYEKPVETHTDTATNGQQPMKVSDRVELLLNEVNGLQSGPFAPLAKHPIVGALAMPFGGVGGLYLIDYLTTLNW
jgi:hypothetical protein